MANEITCTIGFAASKGGATENVSSSESLTLTGTQMSSQTITFTNTTAAVPVGATTAGGIILIKNMETNPTYILWVDNATPVGTPYVAVGPGETVKFRTIAAQVLYAKNAVVGNLTAQVTVLDN